MEVKKYLAYKKCFHVATILKIILTYTNASCAKITDLFEVIFFCYLLCTSIADEKLFLPFETFFVGSKSLLKFIIFPYFLF